MMYFALCLLLATKMYGFSQQPASKIVDFATIKSWMNTATPHQVVAQYGEASRELIRPNETVPIYQQGTREYTFRFNEARQLEGFILDTKESLPLISYLTLK